MKRFVSGTLGAAGLALMLAAPAGATEIHCEGNEATLSRYLKMFDTVFNGRDLSQVEKYVSPDFRSRYAPAG